MASFPFPEPPHTAEDSEPFTCAICNKDISADRPPSLNLDNCMCGELGTWLNDPEDVASGNRSSQVREEMMEAVHTTTSRSAGKGTQDRLKNSNSNEKVSKVPEEDNQGKHPSPPKTPNLPFAMAAYLAAKYPQERPYHESLGLNHSLKGSSANVESSDIDISRLLFHHPNLSTSTCATKATSSMRSSWSSHRSWGSQVRTCSSDTLIWSGAWQEGMESARIRRPPELYGSSSESLEL